MTQAINTQNGAVSDLFGFLATPLGPQITVGQLVLDYLRDGSLSQHPELGLSNKQLMVMGAREFLNRHPDTARWLKEQERIYLPEDATLEEATSRLVRELDPQFQILRPYYLVMRCWKRFKLAIERSLQEDNPELRWVHICRLFVVLNHAREPLALIQKGDGNDEALGKLVHLLRLCSLSSAIEARFRAVIEKEGLDPSDPEQVAECYEAMQHSQKRAAAARGVETLQQLEETIRNHGQNSFDFGRFLEAEVDVSFSKREHDADLWRLWVTVAANHPEIAALLPPQPADDPNWDLFEEGVRACLNNPANAQALSQMRHLRLGDNPIEIPWLEGLPTEIRRFTGLESLSILGGQGIRRLTGLPEEMRTLQALKSLSVGGWHGMLWEENIHDLREFPPVVFELHALESLLLSGPIEEIPVGLQNLRRLSSLTILGSRIETLPEWLADFPDLSTLDLRGSRIRTIPDAVWRHVYWNRLGFISTLPLLDGGGERTIDLRNTTFGIDPEQLTDIPYSLDFLHSWEMSYPTVVADALIDFGKDMIGWFYDQDWYVRYPLTPIMAPLVLIGMVASVALWLLQLLVLHLPIFLYNTSLFYLIEPLAREIRLSRGEDLMVHLDRP